MATKIEKAAPAEKSPATRPGDWLDVFDRWFADFPRPSWLPEFRQAFGEGVGLPRVEEFTEGDLVVVRAEMPGIDPDKDVQITVSDHTLHLRAERRQESETEEKGGYRSEFHYGSFARTLTLPVGATDKDVKATYKDGILEVRIPLDRKEAEARKVAVERV